MEKEFGGLPEGWVKTTLQEIASWGSGGTPSRKYPEYFNGDIPWIKTGDLGPRIIKDASEFITEKAVKNSSAKFFPKNSVVIAMYGATIGRTSILGIDATTNQACAVGTPIEGITTSLFLYYFLLDQKDSFIAKGKGGAQPNISQAVIKEHVVFLPSEAEQEIIVENLDSLLAQVDNIKTRLDQIPQILKRFRQAVLSAAVNGQLTRGYANQKWAIKKLSEIGNFERGKSKHRPRNDPRLFGDKYPFIQTGEVAHSNGILLLVSKYYSEFGFAQSKLFPKGTLCITIAANIADTCILGIDACFPDSVVGFTPEISLCDVRFVKYLIDDNKEKLEAFAPATAQKNINLKLLNSLQFPIPSLSEQTEIVARVEKLFAWADNIEKQVNNAQQRVNNLTQSILAKAFRGELTEQWRKDHPELISGENSAAALLEKIKAERAAQTKKSKKKA
ncbi:restriction endonuclease subunit S [Buttiauxella massiliensis]|uniref:restriction endonuclease subunit S n=1 Tax=Buttiauxella massiliensis TaxID=2831590 RepID=UPI00125FE096|nr:restriction endonuclease subunit S [Buttiauxella massiliensis]